MTISQDTLTGQTIHLRSNVSLQVCHHPGRSPALVFLHGGLGNRFNWRSQIEFAQAQGWETLAYDLAGHGESSTYQRYSLGRHRRDLTRLLNHLKIQSPILCCHSYGVPLGLEWMQRHSASAFIAICGGTHNLAPWWEVPLMKFLTWGGRHLYQSPKIRKVTNSAMSSHRHDAIQKFFVESPIPTDHHPYRALEIFWGYNFFTRHTTQKCLELPALIISGGQDPTFTRQMGVELAARFSQGEHLHLDPAGHLVMAEFPDDINQAIAGLIDRVHSK